MHKYPPISSMNCIGAENSYVLALPYSSDFWKKPEEYEDF